MQQNDELCKGNVCCEAYTLNCICFHAAGVSDALVICIFQLVPEQDQRWTKTLQTIKVTMGVASLCRFFTAVHLKSFNCLSLSMNAATRVCLYHSASPQTVAGRGCFSCSAVVKSEYLLWQDDFTSNSQPAAAK